MADGCPYGSRERSSRAVLPLNRLRGAKSVAIEPTAKGRYSRKKSRKEVPLSEPRR